MAAGEFHEWMLYERFEPFGDRRAEYHAAMITTMLANIHRSAKTRAWTPADFMQTWDPPLPPKPQSPEDQMAIMLHLQAMQRRVGRA